MFYRTTQGSKALPLNRVLPSQARKSGIALSAACLLVVNCLVSVVLGLPNAHAAFPDAVDGQPLPSLAPMLERVTPAVVNISTRAQVPRRTMSMEEWLLRDFFGQSQPRPQAPEQSLGSGVIIDAQNGLVVTNHHVIANASEIMVTLSDGREVPATLKGEDPEADIALISIEADNLVQLNWADSDELRVGDFCVAIGNPFGLGQTVTSGIISALGRSGLGIEDFEDFIQTDASINPGNSGGALVNLRGELLGINTAIVGPSGGNVGIGFAIPANMAADLVSQLNETGEVRRGALGIEAQMLSPSLAEAFGLEDQHGLVVGRVLENSPAARAGLRVGDIITEVDGRKVRGMRELRNRIGLVRLGEQLSLGIVRDRRALSLDVTVEAPPENETLMEGARLVERESVNGRRFVQIESIRKGSLASRTGLAVGDIILSIDRKGVGTLEDIRRIVREAGAEVMVLVQRGRSTMYFRLPKS